MEIGRNFLHISGEQIVIFVKIVGKVERCAMVWVNNRDGKEFRLSLEI